MADSWWRSPAAADGFADHDYADFAQEFLRRSPDYRLTFANTEPGLAADPQVAPKRDEGLATRWGLSLPCNPDASPITEPAQWSPDALATVVVLEAPSDAAALNLPKGARIRVEQYLPGRRQLVIDLKRTRFRLALLTGAGRPSASIVIPIGAGQRERAESTLHFLRALDGYDEPAAKPFSPTAYARQRLVRFLALIDARAKGLPARDITRLLIFPNARLPQGAAWKGSGERRHTLRLIAQGQKLMRGGYRTLPGFIRPSRLG